MSAENEPKGLASRLGDDAYADDKSEKVRGVLHKLLEQRRIGEVIYPRTSGPITDDEDITNTIIAVLLDYNNANIRAFVNRYRKQRGLAPINIDRRIIYEFRQAYSELIDTSYIEVAKFIGTIYPYADKIKRIGFLNEILERLGKSTLQEMDFPDEFTLKKVNMMIKASDRIDAEMGKKTMAEFLTPRLTNGEVKPIESKEELLKRLEAKHSALPKPQENNSKIEDAVIIPTSNDKPSQ